MTREKVTLTWKLIEWEARYEYSLLQSVYLSVAMMVSGRARSRDFNDFSPSNKSTQRRLRSLHFNKFLFLKLV